ncbi:MAG: aminoglycoside adenylyltransferase domain-containing protein [Streptosporangiales bacterium]
MTAQCERYVTNVAALLAGVLGASYVGAYLHGSAVLGDFDPRRSDIDVLAVCEEPTRAEVVGDIAAALNEESLPCPAAGLEFSLVTRYVAAGPTARPPFELHLTTAPGDAKVVFGRGHPGDTDLVLHLAVCRQAGRLVGSGAEPASVFAPVPRPLVFGQLTAELRWAVERSKAEYTVLNACRAWLFASGGVFVSKLDGGRWALRHADTLYGALIRAAMARYGDPERAAPLEPEEAHAFATTVIDALGH